MAAAQEERSVDATVAAFSSEPDGIFTGKEEQRAALEAFLGGKDVFTSHATGFAKCLVKHCDEPQVSSPHTNREPGVGKNKSLICCFECDTQNVCPITFYLNRPRLSKHVLWARNPTRLGNIPFARFIKAAVM